MVGDAAGDQGPRALRRTPLGPGVTDLMLGAAAPDFTLPSTSGAPVSLSALQGGPVALVFFPFAFSSTCTGGLGVEDHQQIVAEGMDHDPEHAGEIIAAAMAHVRDVAAARARRHGEPVVRLRVRPVSQAQAAIPTRFRTPSLFWMRARWLVTVLSEMNSSAAIPWWSVGWRSPWRPRSHALTAARPASPGSGSCSAPGAGAGGA